MLDLLKSYNRQTQETANCIISLLKEKIKYADKSFSYRFTILNRNDDDYMLCYDLFKKEYSNSNHCMIRGKLDRITWKKYYYNNIRNQLFKSDKGVNFRIFETCVTSNNYGIRCIKMYIKYNPLLKEKPHE